MFPLACRYAALGTVDALRKLIVDLEADVNLPMKDGTTPAHCAAHHGQPGMLLTEKQDWGTAEWIVSSLVFHQILLLNIRLQYNLYLS